VKEVIARACLHSRASLSQLGELGHRQHRRRLDYGGTTTKTTYYYANGARIAMAVNGAFSYLASDGLGSANVTLNGSGTATASVL
jgi:hypothetical protein